MSLMYEDAARQPDQEPACEIGDVEMPPGHQGHHWHVDGAHPGAGIVCSCGRAGGATCYVLDPRYWSEDPAVVAEVRAEDDAREAASRCSICGRRGVMAEDDWLDA